MENSPLIDYKPKLKDNFWHKNLDFFLGGGGPIWNPLVLRLRFMGMFIAVDVASNRFAISEVLLHYSRIIFSFNINLSLLRLGMCKAYYI